jgi:two-component system chemotaxis response regulator CheY
LVVEDDERIRDVVRELLEGVAPAGIRTVADGEEALKVLESFPADIVLTEGNLTGMDSLNLLRPIRNKKTSPNADVLVVVMASMAENQRLQRMCGIGIEAFIKKPISNEIVLKRLVSTLSDPRRFVSSLGYFGPDRRGRVDVARPGPGRRRVVELSVSSHRP